MVDMTEDKIDCKQCGVSYIVSTRVGDIDLWENGGIIQSIMSYLTVNDRELLISGTCEDCYNEMFPPDPLDNED